jgi:hypothetical protein
MFVGFMRLNNSMMLDGPDTKCNVRPTGELKKSSMYSVNCYIYIHLKFVEQLV